MKRLTLLLFMLSLGASLWAQRVTLEECRHWAKENYPLVQKYGLVAKSMDYSVLNALRAWLPQVRLSAQATWQTDAASFPDEMTAMLATLGTEIEGIRQDQYKLALDVQQNIWDGGRSAAEKRIAQQQAEVDRLSTDMDFHALEGRVDDLFFGILLIEEQRSQIASRLALLEDNLRRCQVMKDNGLLMQSDVDAVEAELLTARQQSEQFDRSCEAYREMLSLLTGKPMSETLLTTPEARPSL
ncbi:MAG: TolC family protein, partial [Bacteroidales bacterium]|nr:TolC family protein [Bacteroidales bacterium]